MRTRILALVAVALALVAFAGYRLGYQRGQYRWTASSHTEGITLAKVLQHRGITRDSILHFRFVGDENSFTAGRVATNSTDVAWIWQRMIETAEPYSFWESSGYRRLEIYTRDGPQPAVVLFVNATDATSIEGDDRRFICRGLHELAMQQLSQKQAATTE